MTAAMTALAVALSLAFVLTPAPRGAAAAEGGPAVELSRPEAPKGGELTVGGSGWRPGALLMLLVCGEAAPGRGLLSGTNACANADGRAVTTDARGAFSRKLPVPAPPAPCPCVVHAAAVTGGQAGVDVPLRITGHPVAPLPEPSGDGRLAVLAGPRLEGASGLLVRFGAPARRTLVLTVGNLGSAPVENPVFEVGTAHGVFAPQWQERQWRGTIAPGRKARVELPVELAAGAHGDYQVSVRHGGRVLAEQPWGVDRPWGVVLFRVLLALVVPAGLYRIGMAVVDRVRPRHRPAAAAPVRATAGESGTVTGPVTPVDLPWFAPDSAPTQNRPTTKGHS
ncbi:hypothetical protein [Streptomyces sp. NRRL S-118]|uniref:hypothetical protein n=1 Tax=Streptomyces sp. NRRL S-118 TaxID=1463881 RepID=UPI0006941CEC|nr:hypothetical protein [Streptomyces sp. NRRL S-118]